MDEILGHALLKGEIEPYLQPIYNLKEQSFTSAELLTRCSKYGMPDSSPSKYLHMHSNPEVQDAHLKFTVNRSLEFLDGLLAVNSTIKSVSVNIDITDITRRFLDWLEAKCLRRADMLQGICFEISEHVDCPITPTLLQRIHEMKRLGVQIAIDDYGKGFSTDQRVYSVPSSIIKIDKSLYQPSVDQYRINFLAEKCFAWKASGKSVVLECIETAEHLKLANTIGATHAQGFLFTKALPFLDAVSFARQSSEEHNYISRLAQDM